MKLIHKLTLAFLFVSLIAIGLAAAFVGVTTSIKFNKYLVDQRQDEFVSVVTNFYRSNSNWNGVDTALRERGLLPPIAQPGSNPPDPQPFSLVDQDRAIIIPGGNYKIGEKIQKGVLARGIGIEIDGLVVGTVLRSGETPVRNTIEEKYINSIYQSLLVAAVGGVVIALLLGLFLARTLTRPLSDLSTAIQAMAEGKFKQQVPVRSQDELGELAKSFNHMSADLAHANQMYRQMTADIAHDLRNPLTVIGGYLESLQDGKLEPTPERFATMQAEIQHLQRLVNDLRTLSLADAGDLKLHRQLVFPGELLERVAEAYRLQAEEKGICLKVDYEPHIPPVDLDPERMEQVLGNLVSNALRYTLENGKIVLLAKTTENGLELSVQDNGSGISAEILPRIFERSFRGDPARSENESGLGLAIAKSIVEAHGGRISAASQPGRGSCFTIIMP